MQCIVLGSGTSHGVPVIGCSCPVCTSDNPKNNRTRSSLWVHKPAAPVQSHHKRELSILFDTSTDFRTQALREGINTLDAVFLTHAHADHIHGLDDVRPLTYDKTIPVYGNRETIEEIRRRFDYIFKSTQKGGGKPNIELRIIEEHEITIGDITVTAVPIKHGELDILAYRINDLVYCTDCSFIPEPSFRVMKGCKTLVIGALREKPHATHFSVGQALESTERIKPVRAYLTHICHKLEHDALTRRLPNGVEPAWDGLRINC